VFECVISFISAQFTSAMCLYSWLFLAGLPSRDAVAFLAQRLHGMSKARAKHTGTSSREFTIAFTVA
jgi:hypothetical protein